MLKIKYHKSEINFIVGVLGLNYNIYYKIQYKTLSKIPHDLNMGNPRKKNSQWDPQNPHNRENSPFLVTLAK